MQTLPACPQSRQAQHRLHHAPSARSAHRSPACSPLAAPQIALRPCASQRQSCTISRAAPAQAADVTESSSITSEADSNGATATSGLSPIDAVTLETGAGADYTALREHLAAGRFQKADDETRAKLIQVAGKDAIKRNWVYFSEVQFIPAEDLNTMDALWRAASNDKFGFSVQKEVWQQNRKYWTKFFKAISWVTGERNNYRKWPQEFIYSLEAPKGHLPLTNCLRGTQLFEAILMHPAFIREEKRPEWLK